MNAKEALDALNKGDRVRTEFDGKEIFYQMYQDDNIARMIAKSYCTAAIISWFTPEDFLSNHDSIKMVSANI